MNVSEVLTAGFGRLPEPVGEGRSLRGVRLIIVLDDDNSTWVRAAYVRGLL